MYSYIAITLQDPPGHAAGHRAGARRLRRLRRLGRRRELRAAGTATAGCGAAGQRGGDLAALSWWFNGLEKPIEKWRF